MNRILTLVMFGLALLIVAPSTLAQTAEPLPEATPIVVSGDTSITIAQSPSVPVESTTPLFDIGKAAPYIAVIILLIVLLVVEVVDKRRLAELAAKSLTPEAYAVIAAGIHRGIEDAAAYVQGTITPLDDALFGPTRTQVEDLLARIQALEDAKSSSADASTRGGS